MKFCCQVAENSFESRNMDGEFLVAGLHPDAKEVWFFDGFNMAHRRDYSDVQSAIKAAKSALEKIGISNFKLSGHRCVHFCSHCGVKLRDFYGPEGGSLRDDEYVRQMQ